VDIGLNFAYVAGGSDLKMYQLIKYVIRVIRINENGKLRTGMYFIIPIFH
jgi:hypothetical protein